jgi:excisionase family DNA binding protein
MKPLQVKVKDAAALLSYCRRTIENLIAQGELKAVGTGRLRRVTMASIEEYQERHAKKAA